MFFKKSRTFAQTLVAATFLATGIAASPTIAGAQQQVFRPGCAPHQTITKVLENRHKEIPSAYGIMGNQYIIQVFVSDKGDWTVIRTDHNGIACVVATGHSWETLKVQPGEGV